jgi:hypothetical protein|tara:strand:+ start:315 stop:563 length:249 start_codon:yes stop_codon:yes gene_type:complete
MSNLSDEAKAYFREMGRKGGKSGNHAAKGCGGDPVLREALNEINRTRRTKAEHEDNCFCDSCRRYFSAQLKLKDRREAKGKE